MFDNDPLKVSDRITNYGLFIDPPLDRVGMPGTQAREAGKKVLIGKMMMARIGRASERSETQGFMKSWLMETSSAFSAPIFWGSVVMRSSTHYSLLCMPMRHIR